MATPKWFDADVYMQNKLVQMQASDPAYTMTDLVDAFAKAGYVGPEGYYAHFVQYGADEDVAPTPSSTPRNTTPPRLPSTMAKLLPAVNSRWPKSRP